MKYILTFVVMLATFIILDLLWLTVIAKNFYAQHLSFWMAPEIKWYAAIIFYLIFILGLLFFVVKQHSTASLPLFFMYAAGFGLVTYATYDFVNLATIKNWPEIIAFVDCCWGMVITLLTALMGRFIFLLF